MGLLGGLLKGVTDTVVNNAVGTASNKIGNAISSKVSEVAKTGVEKASTMYDEKRKEGANQGWSEMQNHINKLPLIKETDKGWTITFAFTNGVEGLVYKGTQLEVLGGISINSKDVARDLVTNCASEMVATMMSYFKDKNLEANTKGKTIDEFIKSMLNPLDAVGITNTLSSAYCGRLGIQSNTKCISGSFIDIRKSGYAETTSSTTSASSTSKEKECAFCGTKYTGKTCPFCGAEE